MPQAPVLSLSSRLTSAFHTVTNPNGEEANWGKLHSPTQSRAVVYLRKTGMLALAGVATIESLALWILRSASWLLSPFTVRPYNFFAKLLESSTFTIHWNWKAMGDITTKSPRGDYTLCEQWTRESSARLCGSNSPMKHVRLEDEAEFLNHPWATNLNLLELNIQMDAFFHRLLAVQNRLIQAVMGDRIGDARDEFVSKSARDIVVALPDDLAELRAIAEGRLESPQLLDAILCAAIKNKWELDCLQSVESDVIRFFSDSPSGVVVRVIPPSLSALRERFARDPQIVGSRGFFRTYVLPEVPRVLLEDSTHKLAAKLADQLLPTNDNRQNPGRDTLIDRFRSKDSEVMAFTLTKVLESRKEPNNRPLFACSETMQRLRLVNPYIGEGLPISATFSELERRLAYVQRLRFELEDAPIPAEVPPAARKSLAKMQKVELLANRNSKATRGDYSFTDLSMMECHDVTQGFREFEAASNSLDSEYYKPLAEYELSCAESGLQTAVTEASAILKERLTALHARLAAASAAAAAV